MAQVSIFQALKINPLLVALNGEVNFSPFHFYVFTLSSMSKVFHLTREHLMDLSQKMMVGP